MGTIDFSYNWNKKLDCDCFTTFRIHNPKKYQVAQNYLITLKKEALKECIIKSIKTMKLSKVNDFIAYIDTGYSVEEFKKLVRTMYKDIANIEEQDFDFILLKTIRKVDKLFP